MIARIMVAYIILVLAVQSASGATSKVIRSGWYPWDPFLRIEKKNDVKVLTGLGVELTKAIFQDAGYELVFDESTWSQALAGVKDGTRDVVIGALRTKEREEYAYYSDPYRQQVQMLYLPKGTASKYHFKNVDDMLSKFKKTGFCLGVCEGYAFGSAAVEAYVADPANSDNIVRVDDDCSLFQVLMEGKIDGFFITRLVGATTAWRNGWQSLVEEHPFRVASSDIHVIFSKKTTSPAMVEEFNRSLRRLKARGEYKKIIRHYLFPVLLAQTVERDWFLIIDIIGTIAFAISGVALARKEGYDIFGAFVLSALPAFGGGLMRDILVGRRPVGILRTPVYVLAALLTVLISYLAFHLSSLLASRLSERSDKRVTRFLVSPRTSTLNDVVVFFDAIGLSAFTVIGVVVAVEYRCTPLWIWGAGLAALTGAGGGILRDVVRADSKNPSLKGSFYPEVAVIWGFLLSCFILWETTRMDPRETFIGVIVTLVGAFLTRLLAVRFRIESPKF